MKLKETYILLILIVVLGSCTTKSERILRNKLNSEKYDFSKLKSGIGNVKYANKDDIQFGIIPLENNDTIKFWFLTHHITSDKGGTIYEFPNGEKEFYSGFHCCEVQFLKNGIEPIKFSDGGEFKKFVEKYDGVKP